MIKLYKNIKHLRESKGLSQDELAKMTGYTSRSSIAKIEKGEVDLTRSKIILFAEALGTTPGKLMGWEEDYEFRDTPEKSRLSFDNVEDFKKSYDKSKLRSDKLTTAIIKNVEKLNNDGKKSLLDYSNFLLDNSDYILDETTGDVSEFVVDAAHGRTDIEVTEEMIQHDDDIMDDENF